MESSALFLIGMFLWSGAAVAETKAPLLAGQDLHIRCPQMTVYTEPMEPWNHIIGFSGGVSITVGDNQLSGREGYLWMKVLGNPDGTLAERYYQVYVYLEGDVSVEQGPRSRMTSSRQATIQNADAIATTYIVTGDVFGASDSRSQQTFSAIRSEPGYQHAAAAISPLAFGPDIPDKARVPAIPTTGVSASAAEGTASGRTERSDRPASIPVVHIASVWEQTSQIKKTTMADGQEVIIASGRFYLWFRTDGERMVEFMADNIVLYLEPERFEVATERRGNELGSGQIRTAYLSGNIVLTEADRTVRADEIFYDFRHQRALIVNASLRTFDNNRGLPIYLRAEKLGRVSGGMFEAENVQLTTSEFYLPQVSLNASKMILLTDEQSVEQRDSAARYDGRLYDVTAKYGNFSFFRWPQMRTNFVRPDMAIRSVRIGNDSDYGTSVETRWHLARLLGLKEVPGVESQLALDYFSERGVGTGVDAEYKTDRSFGELTGYVMTDRGEDDLGDIAVRRNLEPEHDTRGRFTFRHREFFEDGWQVTAETSYLSDRNFLESMYRSEYYGDKEQETLLYAQRIWDNQAFSVLGKIRINDFQQQTEELPTIEYHRIGQSFWDHQLTWYSSSQVSRLRERFDKDDPNPGSGGFYGYATTRNEVDLPLTLGTFKVVPFAAGTYGYEDRDGWATDLNGRATSREDNAILGETGVRGATMFWKEDPYARSEFWNVNGLRHTVTPYFETAVYQPSDASIDMRDYVHTGVTQRWQTHRGSSGATVDWMRLDVNGTWVKDSTNDSIGPAMTYDPLTNSYTGGPSYGPAWFSYGDPSIPMLQRRDAAYYGVVRDTLNADYQWRVTESYTVLSDANYDLRGGQVQQMNVGVSRYVHPDISYYLGSRYLRPVRFDIDEDGDGDIDISETGSHSVIGAITWQLSPRYMATFAQEYNFDFGRSIRTELTVVRQYHRVYYAMSFSIDETLNRTALMFSVWPQGIKEMTVGSRRNTALTGTPREE